MRSWARLGCLIFLVCGAAGTWFLVSRGEHLRGAVPLPNLTGTDAGGLPLPHAVLSLLGTSLPSQPRPSAVPNRGSAAAPDDVTLLVSIEDGQERSQILVDGTPVGRTPYLGQLVCRRGKTITVDRVRSDGTSSRTQHPCTGSSLEIH